MKSWANRDAFHANVIQHLQDKVKKSRLHADQDPTAPPPVLDEELSTWFAQLTLLYGVPLEYLVPDHRMLPEESIRFFYLDRNWLDRLIDGALSVGVLSTKEQLFNLTFFKDIYKQVDIAQAKLRPSLRDEVITNPSSYGGTISGLLMRSKLVSDYPGVEINGYASTQDYEAGTKLTILRMDRLSDSLLICIFDGVPVKVDFVQPSEGLHFEFAQEKMITLRGLGYPKSTTDSTPAYNAGDVLMKANNPNTPLTAAVKMVSNTNYGGVVDVTSTVSNIKTAMETLSPNPLHNPDKDTTSLKSDGLAIQLIYNRGIQSYQINNGSNTAPPHCGSTDS